MGSKVNVIITQVVLEIAYEDIAVRLVHDHTTGAFSV